MSQSHEQPIQSFGGPLFRKPDTSRGEFSASWHRHGQLVSPWFLNFGIEEYTQIHMPNPPTSPAASASRSATERILRQADGIAVVRCRPVIKLDGSFRVWGDSAAHPYFAAVIAVDERRFLHKESGATEIKGNPLAFDVPQIDVDEWCRLALEMGGVESVKIRDGQPVVEGLWWEEWEKHNGKKTGATDQTR